MPAPQPTSCTALFPSGGPSEQPDSLGPSLLDAAPRRLAGLAGILAVAVVFVLALQRMAQPQLTAVIDDPVNRLSSLAAVLMAAGLIALHRTRAVSSHTLLLIGVPFEIVVAFSISMIETSRPFDPTVPLLGMSAVGPWIVLVSAVVPKRPLMTLAVSLAAASTWPLAYGINSNRLDFAPGSLAQLSVWPTITYMLAGLAYLIGRSTYGTSRQAQAAEDLGSYRLELKIGEGGMGEVWRGSHKMLARPAAIKLVKAGEAAKQEVFTRRFRREANAIASLQSPHTVYLYDIGITRDGRLYYVMELLDGISLQALITSFGPQPAARVIAILRQMCLSLEEAHDLQLVHRDLEPSHVMICRVAQRHDVVKVLDFGLAKSVANNDSTQLTMEGVVTGTPGYMAPEVALGNTTIDGRADLYALGCIGYVLLTGTLVFPDSNPMTAALNHVQKQPDPPSARTELGIPADLERLILQCLEKDPDARPQNACDLIRLLDACAVPEAWSTREATRWWERHLPPSSSLRSFAQPVPVTPTPVQKAS